MIAGVGIDVVDIARFDTGPDANPESGRPPVYRRRKRPAAHSLAARFAAKEALAKALGAPRGLLWTDAEIVTSPAGRPRLKVAGTVAAAAARLGVTSWHLSLSHDAGIASAVVIAEGDRPAGLGWV